MSSNGRAVAKALWTRPARWWSAITAQRQERLLLILSILIGALTGLAVVALILLTERLGMRLYPVGSPAWHRVLIPIAGSLAMGYVLFRYFPDARGSGVAQTKAALYVRDGVITLRTVLGKFFCTSATLASGIPLGPEGPSVHVGAGIASVLGRKLGLRSENVKALIPVGAAAAIAAAFNTPLAAVVYSLEEIVGDFQAPVLGSVVLASATSWLILRVLLGNNPLFQVPHYELLHGVELAIYLALGVIGGFVSVAFTKFLVEMRGRFRRLPDRTQWAQPVIGGLLVGLMGWWVPQVLGVGYGYVGDALNGRMALQIMALLVVLKFLAVATSAASGNAGGLFAPSLFLGAMVGGVVGSAAHYVWPAYTAAPGAYALVGMGALFAGIMRAPMTSVLMIFETTHDYEVIVPLMIANMVSYFIASRLQSRPIYEIQAIQDGIHLPSKEVLRRRGQRPVSDVMRPPTDTVRADSTVREVFQAKRGADLRVWPVEDDQKIIDVITLAELQRAIANGNDGKLLSELISDRDSPHVHPDHPLDVALERMGASKLDALPVVSRADSHQILGIIVLSDILKAFGIDRGRSEDAGIQDAT